MDAIMKPNKQQRLSKASKTEVIEYPDYIQTHVNTLVMLFTNIDPPHQLAIELHPFIFQDQTKRYNSDYSKVTRYFLEILETCFDLDNSVVAMAKDAATDFYQSVTRSASKER